MLKNTLIPVNIDIYCATEQFINITLFTNSDGALSKTYDLVNGEIIKTAAANMCSGTAELLNCSFGEFTTLLYALPSNTALGFGVYNKNYGKKVEIVSAAKAKKYKIDTTEITRTKEYFAYATGGGILMLDHDPSNFGITIDADTFIKILCEIMPYFKNSAYCIKPSVSSTVKIKGGPDPEVNGYHVYIPVVNAADIPRFGKTLFDRLWLHGYGYIALSKNGSMLERSCIDGSVFSPERLDFAGEPVITSRNLEHIKDGIVINDGMFFDTSMLHDLTDAEIVILETLKTATKDAIAPKAAEVRAIWREEKIEEQVKNGIPRQTATRKVDILGSMSNRVGN